MIVLGWTHRTPTIVQELLLTRDRVERFLERQGARDLRIVILADHVDATVVQELRERLSDQEQADATTTLNWLMLRDLLPREGKGPELLIELLDHENRFLFPPVHEQDLIVSPTLVGYLLSQVALRRELAGIIDELARPWGAQIVLRPAGEYLATNEPVRFPAAGPLPGLSITSIPGRRASTQLECPTPGAVAGSMLP